MEKGKLMGIVTDQDLKRASAPDVVPTEIDELLYLMSKVKVGEIMTKDPITVLYDYTVEETAEVLLTNKISGAPVVNHEGKIVGTITQSDLFHVLMSLTGLRKRGNNKRHPPISVQYETGSMVLREMLTQWEMNKCRFF